MARLTDSNLQIAKEIIGRYPKARSATIPLLHLSQQQNGYVTNDAIAHVAELVGATSGLGFLINDARSLLRTDIIILGMLVIGLAGFGIDLLIRRLSKVLLPWSVGAQK